MDTEETQKELIEEGEWDWLIILDACRYDFFEDSIPDYLEGDLKKVVSEGSSTHEWLVNTFGGETYPDVVYVSSNVFINSKGITSGTFDGNDHFYDIIDAWEFAWSDIKTVRPEAMEKACKKTEQEYPGKKKIVHYIQPHQPYLKAFEDQEPNFVWKLSKNFFSIVQNMWSLIGIEGDSSSGDKDFRPDLENRMGKWFGKKFGRKFNSYLMEFLGLPATTPFDVYLRGGRKRLEEYYEYNLRKALESVSRLVSDIEGKSIISADHGEFLGIDFNDFTEKQRKQFNSNVEVKGQKKGPSVTTDDGREIVYGHIEGVDSPVLREVPWFEVNN